MRREGERPEVEERDRDKLEGGMEGGVLGQKLAIRTWPVATQ